VINIEKDFGDMVITKTIARKLSFLFIKMLCNIPTLIMGETGVGKTYLVRYLSCLNNGAFMTLNVHGGLTQLEI
jgi:MoxR-like ATPase